MSNENCLEGIACPKCYQEDLFYIVGTAVFEVTDEGTDTFETVVWDDESNITCGNPKCKHPGKVKEFSNKT